MAKRKMLFHPDYVREKIRASQLINRLQKCAFGEISLTVTQLRAIEILLRKSIPDLAAAEIRSEQMYRYVVELPPVLSKEEWLEKYGGYRADGGSAFWRRRTALTVSALFGHSRPDETPLARGPAWQQGQNPRGRRSPPTWHPPRRPAAVRFGLDEIQRTRIMVQELT